MLLFVYVETLLLQVALLITAAAAVSNHVPWLMAWRFWSSVWLWLSALLERVALLLGNLLRKLATMVLFQLFVPDQLLVQIWWDLIAAPPDQVIFVKAASNELLMINVDLICVIVEGKLNPFGVCTIDEAMLGLQISCLAGFHRTTTLDLAIDNRAILLSRCFNTRPSRLLFRRLSPAELLRSELRRLFQLMRAIVECGSTCAVIVLRGS